jgi:hypothetical protein
VQGRLFARISLFGSIENNGYRCSDTASPVAVLPIAFAFCVYRAFFGELGRGDLNGAEAIMIARRLEA